MFPMNGQRLGTGTNNFTLNQIKANANAMGYDIYGKVHLPDISEQTNEQLYMKLKNNITYNTTGFDREERNIGSRTIERW